MPTANYPTLEATERAALAKLIVRTGITDVADTAFLKSLAKALARGLDRIAYASQNQRLSWNIATAAGADLDARAQDYLPQGLVRLPATAASGQVVFSRSNANAANALTIPQGFVVGDGNGNNFGLSAPITLPALTDTSAPGNQTATAQVSALTPGAASNVAANAANIFQSSRPASIDSVTNPIPITGGADQQQDDAFRQRIYAYVASLAKSTAPAIVEALLGTQDANGQAILSCTVVRTAPGVCNVYIDNGSGTLVSPTTAVTNENLCQSMAGGSVTYNGLTYPSATGVEQYVTLANAPVDMDQPVTLISNLRGNLVFDADYFLDQTTGQLHFAQPLSGQEVVLASYTWTGGLLQLAQRIVSGVPGDYATYPGVAAAGVQAIVTVPNIVIPTITLQTTLANGYAAVDVVPNVQAAIVAVVNALNAGQPLYVASLIQTAMNVQGVADVVLSSPTADVVVGAQTIIRCTSPQVT